MDAIDLLTHEIRAAKPVKHYGKTSGISGGVIEVKGLSGLAAVGDRLRVGQTAAESVSAEVVAVDERIVSALPEGTTEGIAVGHRVELLGALAIQPDTRWLGRIINPSGRALDGRALPQGREVRRLSNPPPPAAERKALGSRLETGIAVFNTLLPIVRGQRIGLFAGSGVGKSTLLADMARGIAADVVVIALVGERGRELRDFVEHALGPEQLRRAVVVVATSDQPALVRRRCAQTAMTVAEFFRDQGNHVLFLADSVTRFAEAHREIAVAGGEAPSLRGFPPSTSGQIMALAERAGPGAETSGDITAVFSVLVAGSDMEEPVADILRGTLDGHVVMDRAIAERGRFPAIDVLKSVSRSLPRAATEAENALIAQARRLMGAYAESELMIRSGLYTAGADAFLDEAIEAWPRLDAFIGAGSGETVDSSFADLRFAIAPGG